MKQKTNLDKAVRLLEKELNSITLKELVTKRSVLLSLKRVSLLIQDFLSMINPHMKKEFFVK